MLPKVLLVTSAFLCFRGWFEVLNNNLVSKSLHNVPRKELRNLLSLLETMDFGMRCSFTISKKYNLATYLASSTMLPAIKCAILENSTTTMITSLSFFVLGTARMKYMLTCCQSLSATGKDLYSPVWNVNLALWHVSHLRMYLPTVQTS